MSDEMAAAGELEPRVAQRTAQLARANEDLQREIASRKRAEEDLRSSEERHRVIVEAASDAIVAMDDSGIILFANPATTRLFGYDSAEMVGKPLTMLMPQPMRELHDDGFRRYLATGIRHINWHGTELTAISRDGQEFPVEVSFGELSTDGHRLFTGFIRDIRQRKQAEQLEAAAQLQGAVHADVTLAFGLEGSLETILRECAESMVRRLDAAFARIWILNRDAQMLELRASAGLYTHLDGAHARIPMGTLKIGAIAKEKTPVICNDLLNDPRIIDKAWAEKEGMAGFAGYPLLIGARTLGVLAMFSRKPVTTQTIEVLASIADLIAQGIERKRAEDDLRATERRLKEMETELARVVRVTSMGELAASIAHEVNQPLTAVVNNGNACLRLLANRKLEPDTLRLALEEIVADGTRASSILSSIRAFITKQAAEKTSLDVNEVIQEVLALAGREIQAHEVLLNHQLEAELPLVLGDRIQLQQVVLNLIMNGIEAMTTLTDRPRSILVKSELTPSNWIQVAVRDSGTGFSSQPEHLFSPFYTTKKHGMGMGLSISRSLIESHGGRLQAMPLSPHGAEFSFTLPVAPEARS